MKTLQEMLRELARADVSEFAVASDRLPCLKIGAKYEPVDEKARTTEQILEMLVTSGGSRYVEDLNAHPVAWTWRVDGLGSVGVQAVMRDGRVQARFVLVRKASRPKMAATAHPRTAPQPAVVADDEEPPSSRQLPTEPPPARVSPAAKVVAPISVVPPSAEEVVSEPLLRGAVVKPTGRGEPTTLDGMLADARDAKASDVHLVAGRPLLLRLGGELVPRGKPVDSATVEKLLAPVIPERLRATLEEQGSCDFALGGKSGGRFRINVSRQRTGLKACFRLIPAAVPTLESLGLPAEIEKATHHHQGLVVVTGPTGHGKTSTLAAIVDILNRTTTHHIITVEDPIEFLHPRKKAMVSQREVGSNTRSFASALKGSLREDPDVIVVGELRDTETVRMALAASETGHLVLGTMNTPSAAKTIDRLVDLFPPADQAQVRMTLAGGLHLVVSQRLLPAADGSGVVAAVELLPGSIALWAMIRDNKTFQIPSLQQRGRGFGILRLDESLLELVKAGRVTREAALAAAEYPDELEAILDGKRPAPGAPAPAPQPQPKPETAGGLLGKAGQISESEGREVAKIDHLFDALIAQGGSDLHLGIGYPPLMRLRGDLVEMRKELMTPQEMEELLFEIVTPPQKETITDTLDLDFAYAYADKARFRANYFYKATGLAAVFRTIPTKVLTLEDLKCPPVLRKLSDRKAGLVLVTGPTGSGKSTTLAAMIDHINKTRACHVLTIEDPVEFVHSPQKAQITHREVGPHASTYAHAIRSAGREDPNVILIGELRTNETMKLALQLASFGILVFATVHTNSAAATIDRIVNAFPADEQPQVRGMLAESLAGIVAQQLLRTADGKKRVAVHEILVGSPALASMIRENKTFQIPSLMQGGGAQGMQTMDMALERLVREKTVTVEHALEKAIDKESFAKVFKQNELAPL